MDNQYSTAIAALEKVFGKTSEAGFGSAVFHEGIIAGENVEGAALAHYRKFLGPKWTAETEPAWMAPWKIVFTRVNRGPGIMSELASISDAEAKRSVLLLTEFTSNPEAAVKALGSAFDHDHVKSLSVSKIGDGEAMSGIMITAIYNDMYSCSVITLMD